MEVTRENTRNMKKYNGLLEDDDDFVNSITEPKKRKVKEMEDMKETRLKIRLFRLASTENLTIHVLIQLLCKAYPKEFQMLEEPR